VDEASEQPDQQLAMICEEKLRMLVEKTTGLRIEAKRVKQHIGGEQLAARFHHGQRALPSIPAVASLAKEKLSQQSQRAAPKRLTSKRSPTSDVVRDFRQALEAGPVCSQVMFKPDAIAADLADGQVTRLAI
jgi:hypothetical protein